MGARRRQGVAWLTLVVPVAVIALLAGGATSAVGHDARSAPAQATVTPGNVIVQGQILYIDRDSDRSHPAVGLKVEIWDKDERSFDTGQKLDEVVTDSGGFFISKEVSDRDTDGPTGQVEGTQDIYLKLFTNNGDVRVFKTNTTQEYSWPSYVIDPVDGLARNVPNGVFGMPTLYVMEDTNDVEALWTFVNLVEGWQYMKAQTGENPGPVVAFWSKASQEGPRYDAEDHAIYLRDADASFRSVIVQQEAYALIHNSFGTLPAEWTACTAGPTDEVRSAIDPACAFIQGFATFFPLAVYADATFASQRLRAMDLDAPQAGTLGWANGDAVPGRIAGAFWDLSEADTTVEFYDKFDATFADIWQVIDSRRPTTMREWWEGWKAEGKDSCAALGSLFQNTIDYNTAPTVAPIADITLDEDTTKFVSLSTYVTDAECPDERLTYTLADAGDPKAGVALGATGMISITPAANWFGETRVTVRVSDGPATVTASFRVVVRSVNDCPAIAPRVGDMQAKYGDPIVLNLLPHATDVEDQIFQLVWDAELEPLDEQDVVVEGVGTTTLTFRLAQQVTTRRSVRVLLIVKDREGCETRQPVVLTWTSRPNQLPFIDWDRFERKYRAKVNHKVIVDLTNVANDDEDGPDTLEWFAEGVTHAQVGIVPGQPQVLQFEPDIDWAGIITPTLVVKDSEGATASGEITIEWVPESVFDNAPPMILKNRLLGKTVGKNANACYPLTDKATDPDDPQVSLRWFIAGYDSSQLQVTGQGSRDLCLTARPNFEGCQAATFVVRDPKGAEDTHEISTCWRTIRIVFPYMSKSASFNRLR